MLLQFARGQTICGVEEDIRGPERTLAAHFSVQSITVSVTLPRQLFQRDAVTVFLEAPGSDSANFPRLFMRTGADKVAITDGAALQVTARVHERVAFDLLTETGERLCTWLPPVRISANSPPQLEDGFRHFAYEYFRNAGDPLTLNIGGSSLLEPVSTRSTDWTQRFWPGAPRK